MEQNEEQNEFSPEPSIDELIESSPLLEPDTPEEVKTEEVKTEEVKTEITEEKTETEPVEQGLTEEQFEELSEKHPVLKEYKKFFDNHATWEANLTKKGQSISWLNKLATESPEQYEMLQNKLMPYVYGKEELPKDSKELVETMMENLPKDGIKFVDEDELEVDVPYDKLAERDAKLVESVLTKSVPEMATLRSKLKDASAENETLKTQLKTSSYRQGEMEMESLIKGHKLLELKKLEGESILDAVTRVGKAGEDHPEYSVLVKWNAVGKLADENGWKLDKAYEMLYGADERKILDGKKTKEVIKNNQQDTTQETPDGQTPKPMEDWEEAMEGIGNRQSEISGMFN